MTVTEAVEAAIKYVGEVFVNEKITNLGLEEVIFDEKSNRWKVTVGFSRPWDYRTGAIIQALQGSSTPPSRTYKTVDVDDKSGAVKAIRIRNDIS